MPTLPDRPQKTIPELDMQTGLDPDYEMPLSTGVRDMKTTIQALANYLKTILDFNMRDIQDVDDNVLPGTGTILIGDGNSFIGQDINDAIKLKSSIDSNGFGWVSHGKAGNGFLVSQTIQIRLS